MDDYKKSRLRFEPSSFGFFLTFVGLLTFMVGMMVFALSSSPLAFGVWLFGVVLVAIGQFFDWLDKRNNYS